jgi:Sec-independent protein translocase protein TatA
MKKVGIGCLAVVIIVAAVIALVFFATSDLPKAADAFFSLVQQGKIHEAYLATATEFRAATSEEDFAALLETSALGNYQNASWPSRSVKNNTGKLEGTVTTRDGGQIPVVLDLVKEGEAWKILAFRKAEAGIIRESASAEVPADAELQRLTTEAVALLADAVNKNDFAGFHGQIARLWQGQITADELKQVFASFVENQIDLSPLREQVPVFSQKPAVDADGVLALEGYYPAQPNQVFFKLKFIYEHPQWKLMGINVRL